MDSPPALPDSRPPPAPPVAAPASPVTVLEKLAAIPEEDIWLAQQQSARTRRAYRLDVRHFLRSLGLTTTDELRRVDHRAVIAWERGMRETELAAASTIRRRLAALSSLFAHLGLDPTVILVANSGSSQT